MTEKDIIRLAEESQLWAHKNKEYAAIERFANLVAAAEREACAKECEEPIDLIQITDDCSEYVYKDYLDCAEAIRARGAQQIEPEQILSGGSGSTQLIQKHNGWRFLKKQEGK